MALTMSSDVTVAMTLALENVSNVTPQQRTLIDAKMLRHKKQNGERIWKGANRQRSGATEKKRKLFSRAQFVAGQQPCVFTGLGEFKYSYESIGPQPSRAE